VITSFLAQGLADWLVLTIAPVIVGGLHAVDLGANGDLPGFRLENPGYERLGDDLVVWGKIRGQ
jgi:3,4-dihydroxy 2-butanone 4-phosphate synthase/GTP cyclohydrolase II